MDTFTIGTPVASAVSTSPSVIRHQAIGISGRFSATTARMAAISSGPIAGAPTSISRTPAAPRHGRWRAFRPR